MSTLIGNQGFSITTKAKTMRDPSFLGFTLTTRDIIAPAGAKGFVACTDYNSVLNVMKPPTASVFPSDLTLVITRSGAPTETYNYATLWVTNRKFPVGAVVTIMASGTGYRTKVYTFTATSAISTIPIQLQANASPLYTVVNHYY